MRNFLKAAATLSTIAVLVVPTLTASAASSSVRTKCRAQVNEKIPNVTTESRRTRTDLFKACVNNGGTIPG